MQVGDWSYRTRTMLVPHLLQVIKKLQFSAVPLVAILLTVHSDFETPKVCAPFYTFHDSKTYILLYFFQDHFSKGT